MRTSSLAGAFIISLLVATALTPVRGADMTHERALNPQREPQNWILHHGNYQGHRYSLLKEINADTVKNLKPVFTVALSGFQNGGRYAHGNLEATPLVEDGVMYVPDGWGSVYAIDVSTGRKGVIKWKMDPGIDRAWAGDVACCGINNRGVALWKDKVISVSLDGRMFSINKATGEIVWERKIADPALGETLTIAPLVIRDLAIVGNAGGERGIRGFIEATDLNTGKSACRDGGLYFTDIPPDRTVVPAAVYYVPPRGAPIRVAEGITTPNGLQAQPRREDALCKRYRRYQHLCLRRAAGRAARQSPRIRHPLPPGTPPKSNADGLVTDDDGRLYALTKSGIEVLSPTGQHVGVIPLWCITRRCQNLGFGGPAGSAHFTWPAAARCCGFRCSHADFKAAQSDDILPRRKKKRSLFAQQADRLNSDGNASLWARKDVNACAGGAFGRTRSMPTLPPLLCGHNSMEFMEWDLSCHPDSITLAWRQKT